MENPIHIVRLRSGEDPRTWNGSSWIIDYIFSSSLQKIYLHINPAAQKYLLHLDALEHARVDSILRISRTFPIWLYITLTNASRYGKYWVVSTDMFAKMSMIEDREVWIGKRIGRDTLRVQLGAFTTPAVKEEFTKARKVRETYISFHGKFAKAISSQYAHIQNCNSISALLKNGQEQLIHITFFLSTPLMIPV